MKQPLQPPDVHYFSAAWGWLELGSPAEALTELNQVGAASQDEPDVLELRWMILAEMKRWPEALKSARRLLKVAPERPSGWLHQAYALRRVEEGSVGKALEALLPAFPKFPQEPVIPYNLSCYSCQLQNLDAARQWLERACKVGGRAEIKSMALADPDLRPLWDEIQNL